MDASYKSISQQNDKVPEELLAELQSVPEIAQAIEIAKGSGYSEEKHMAYESL